VLFALIGRDVVDELPYVLRNIERLAAVFARSYVMLVENDSSDGTPDYFSKWAESVRDKTGGKIERAELRRITPPPHLSGKKSLGLLSYARNVYFKALMEEQYREVDYLVAVDTDMCFAWEVDMMRDALNRLLPASGKEWDILFGNGICGWYDAASGREVKINSPNSNPVYCDLFALRDHEGRQRRTFNLFPYPGTCNFKGNDTVKCIHINGEPVIEVRAAFGGLGVYRADLFRPEQGREVCYGSMNGGCEHVEISACFHARGFKQFIASRLVVNWEGCKEPLKDDLIGAPTYVSA
jgi:hypothetical protein